MNNKYYVPNKSGWKRKLSFDQREALVKEHFENKVSQVELAKKYGISRQMVHRYCSAYGESPIRCSYKLNDKEIVRLYVEEKWTVEKIATKFSVTGSCINKRLERSNIKKHRHHVRSSFNKTIPQFRLKLRIWAAKVIDRDGLKCRWCGVEGTFKNRIEAHHIYPIALMSDEQKELCFDISNGVSLCRKCHTKTFNVEIHLADFFKDLIKSKGCL